MIIHNCIHTFHQGLYLPILYVYVYFFLRYKEDPWLWDLEWDVQEFKLKKVAASKKKQLKKVADTQVATPLPDWEEGKGPHYQLCQRVWGNNR